jgi:type IX secretion system PorP/SprF family membrane protein
MKKLLAAWVMVMLTVKTVMAQDPHFSQFFVSPLTLNPAFTGKFDGDFRVAGNHRDQWPVLQNVFVTQTVSVDMPIMRGRLGADRLGIGLLAINDKTAGGALNGTDFAFSTSFHKALDEDEFNTLGIGFQAAYSQRRLDLSKLRFENELTSTGDFVLDPGNPDRQNVQASINYLNLNAGVLFSGSTDGTNNYYVGVSMYNINRPKESFTNGNYVRPSRITIQGGGYLPLSDVLTLHGSAMFNSQAGSSEIVAGMALAANASPYSNQPTNVYFGSWVRVGDALIPYMGLEAAGFRFGASYDINMFSSTKSVRSVTRNKGGIEVSLIYIKRKPEQKGLPCPKF